MNRNLLNGISGGKENGGGIIGGGAAAPAEAPSTCAELTPEEVGGGTWGGIGKGKVKGGGGIKGGIGGCGCAAGPTFTGTCLIHKTNLWNEKLRSILKTRKQTCGAGWGAWGGVGRTLAAAAAACCAPPAGAWLEPGVRRTSKRQVGHVCCLWNHDRKHVAWKMWLHGNFLAPEIILRKHDMVIESPFKSSRSFSLLTGNHFFSANDANSICIC